MAFVTFYRGQRKAFETAPLRAAERIEHTFQKRFR